MYPGIQTANDTYT